MCYLKLRQGPEGRRLNIAQPGRAGYRRQNPSAGGAALYRALPQPDFAILALSRPYPTSQLIWTALTLSRPFGTELGQSHADSLAPANGQDAASKQQTAESE
jgi:hypothetical protein